MGQQSRHLQTSAITDPSIAVLTENLIKRYLYKPIVNRVNLQIPKGSIFSILGPNGAGKSTLIKMIATVLPPSAGQLFVFQHDVKEASYQIKNQIGYMAHQSLLYDELSGWENLVFYLKLMGLKKDNQTNLESRLTKFINLFDVKPFLHEPAAHLSSGQRKRVDLVRTLAHDPNLLVLDEVFTGLDERSTDIVLTFLNQIKQQKTIVLTTHNKNLAHEFSDWICILNKGRIQDIYVPKQ